MFMSNDNAWDDPFQRYSARLADLAATDPQIGSLLPEPAVTQAARRPGLSCDKVIATYLEGYSHRPALGQRAYDAVRCKTTGATMRHYRNEFLAITYGELHDRIKALAMVWRTHPCCSVGPGDCVCIMGFAGSDFATLDMACAYAKAVAVPLSGSASEEDLVAILDTVQPAVLATRIQDLALCVSHALRQDSIKCIIVFDCDQRMDDEAETLALAGKRLQNDKPAVKVCTLGALIQFGSRQTFSFLPAEPGEQDRLAMVMHTSGSTGTPKGACITARALKNTWQGDPNKLPKVSVIMQPFNHNMGRNELCETLSSGGTACFTLQPDMSTLFDDIRLARPTSLVFIPRVLELIYQYFQTEVARRLRHGQGERTSVEHAVMRDMKAGFLGDRLLAGAVASAPIADTVLQFVANCFDIHLVNGYSTTETASGGLAINGKINREIVLDYRLDDAPELGYFNTDTPHPRGEFCVKTKFGIKEYYKQPEATAQLFDAHGFSRTGDIVEEYAPGYIAIIDRKKNIVKLSQGEYVALGPLGKIFEGGSAVIDQVYLHGNSRRSFLLAVVVPDMDAVRETFGSDVDDATLEAFIKKELYRIGRQENLKRFEVPKDIILEKEPFTRANGLLSSVNKYLIPALRRKYGPALESLYEQHEQHEKEARHTLAGIDGASGVEETIAALLKLVLKRDFSGNDEQKNFYELGGDSLAAVLFSMHLEDTFGVRIAADAILNPGANLRLWAALVQASRARNSTAASFDSIHGDTAQVVCSKDLQIEQFLESRNVRNAAALPSANTPPQWVVLTGANGFVGHALCFAWLRTLANHGGKLTCIVRAPSDTAARERLEARFEAADRGVASRFAALAHKHLEVLAGDISQPYLGVGRDTFQRLADSADHICHAGALVNHRLGYRHLFGPNVTGTSEVLRLALCTRKKPVTFISTIGVNDLVDAQAQPHEQAELQPELHLSDAYAAGYIASKWGAEQLLASAHRLADLPVRIFRCDLVLPGQHYSGQINSNDFLSRLLCSILATGLAPDSFYDGPCREDASVSCFAGVPVDALADVIVGAAFSQHDGIIVYNACNYSQGGISLDTFVQWIASAGYSIRKTASYADWLAQIAARLDSLPLKHKQQSIAGMLDAFSKPFSAEPDQPDCQNFKQLVRQLQNGNDLPRITQACFHDYLRSLERLLAQE